MQIAKTRIELKAQYSKDPIMTQYTGDPFSDNIIHEIPIEVRDSFSPTQMNALIDALRKERLNAKHLIDARFTIPLFFTRYYAVFLLGRDLRAHKKQTLVDRRSKGSLFSKMTLITLLIVNGSIVLLLLSFFAAYLAKSMLGIDLFPDMHLWDFLIK